MAAFAGFGQLASKNGGQLPAVFGSASAIGDQTPSSSFAALGLSESSSVFGSGTKVVGFADLAASGSGVDDFTKKSGWYLAYLFFSQLLMHTGVSVIKVNTVTYYNRLTAYWILSETSQVSRYQKGKTSLDFTKARDSEWQGHQLGHMQICASSQTDNTPAPTTYFLQAGCPSCHPTNSVKSLKAITSQLHAHMFMNIHS